MPLMTEYAITPAVFDAMQYSGDEIIYSNFALLREALFNEGIVRNLYDGEWLNVFKDPSREWHQKGKELLNKLIKQNRLRIHPPSHLPFPGNDHDWCEEALQSNESLPLGGLVTTLDTAAHYPRTHALISPIGKLSSAQWWSRRGNSTRLCRNTVSYLEQLRIVLECSKSLMFIDPYLDPTSWNYREFIKILEALKELEDPQLIEIHRTAYVKEGKNEVTHDLDEWKIRFRDSFSDLVSKIDIKIKVFLWKKDKNMHDRFLISDIIGISVPYGFDIGKNPKQTTIWTCLSREDRDEITREYDPACDHHNFVGSFIIG